MTFTITRAHVTLFLALLGSALGVINFFVDYWRNRVRLRVIPKLYVNTGPGLSLTFDRPHLDFLESERIIDQPKLCIEVQNIGHKAVTISEVGFTLNREDASRYVFISPLLADGSKLPARLDAHTAVTAFALVTPAQLFATSSSDFDRAYAVTASDKIYYGSSAIFEQLKEERG